MTDTEIVAAFRQLCDAIAKRDKLEDEHKRVTAEQSKVATQLNEAVAYANRCQNQVIGMAQRGAKLPAPVHATPMVAVAAAEPQRKPVLPVGGIATSPAKPAKVRAL